MTIEALLQEQNDLIRDLIARLTGPSAQPETTKAAPTKTVDKLDASPEAKAAAKADAAKAATAKAETTKVEEAPKAEAPAAATYDDVKNAVTNVVKAKGRQAAVDVLTSLGVASAQELDEAQWQAAIDACKAALNG